MWKRGGREELGEKRSLTGVYDGGLGGVINNLQLGDIDNMAAHAGGADEAASEEVLEGPAVEGGALLLLAAPVQAGGARAVHGAVDVDAEHLLHGVEATVEEVALLPRDPRVRHEHV